MSRLAHPTSSASPPAGPVAANSRLFHDTDAATLAWLREVTLLTLAGPPAPGVDRAAVAGMLADVNDELADRAMLLIQVDPYDLDIAQLVREVEDLRRALAERDHRRPASRPQAGRRVIELSAEAVRRAE